MLAMIFLSGLMMSSAWANAETAEQSERAWRLLRRDQPPVLQIWERRGSSPIRLQQPDPVTERLLRDLAAGSGEPNDRAGGVSP